jgi:S1-C subfamily serine protease
MRIRALVSIVLAALLSSGADAAALADFSVAQKAFSSLPESTKAEMVIDLIATGDFDGIFDGSFTSRLQHAIEAFQTRENFTPTGALVPEQLEMLRRKGNAFIAPLAMTQVDLPSSHWHVHVPKQLFDIEKKTLRHLLFERSDRSLSVAVEDYPSDDIRFDVLYDRLSTSKPPRRVTYRTLQPSYFVSSGEFRGRNFYTWVARTQSGAAGFTLAWKKSQNALAERLAILMANSVSTALPEQTKTLPDPGSPAPGSSGTGLSKADPWAKCASQSQSSSVTVIEACMKILSAEWGRGYRPYKELVYLGDSYFEQGKFHLAIDEYSRSISIEPADYWLYGKRALASLRLGRSSLALKDASVAIGGMPTFALPYLTRAIIFTTLNQRTDALQDLSMAEQKQAAHALMVPKNFAALSAYVGHVISGSDESKIERHLPDAEGSAQEQTSKALTLPIPLLPPAAEITSRYAVSSTGSGFVVDARGYVVTNNHVAANCKAITVMLPSSKVVSAGIVLQDKHDDLALIGISEPWPAAATFADYELRLGQHIVVLGYPLQPFLGPQINVTDGAVSSRTGPNGDLRTFQISAPVQPGNSGGPVLDLSGSVVGTIVAIFGTPKITSELGIVPQNVNFAISGSAIRELMSRANLQPHLLYGSEMSIPDVAEQGSKITVSISCYN